MAIEFNVKFENGSIIITPITVSVSGREIAQTAAPGPVLKSHQLGASFGSSRGGGVNPHSGTGGLDSESGIGGGANPHTGTGGGANPHSGTGGASTQDGVGTFFQMEKQLESEWCWAAVSASVDHFFNPGSALTQCEIASQVTRGDCCANPAPFNLPERLEDALSAVGKLRQVTTGPLTFEQVQSELDADCPVCVRIEWDGETAHFVAISGYKMLTSGVRMIDIADPHYADSTVDFDLFPSHYQGNGTWTTTFLTKKQEGKSNVLEINSTPRSYPADLQSAVELIS